MKKIIPAFLLILFLLPVSNSQARLEIELNKGNFEPIPIALHGFTSNSLEEDGVNEQLLSVISNNLKGTGMFKLIDKNAFLEKLLPGQTTPNFRSWSQIGSQALVTGTVRKSGGSYVIEFRLWDVLSGQQIAGTSYTTSQKGLRRVAHQVSDQIYSRLTGEDGYFDSRIVYVAESGPATRRVKRLAIMDQDGYNHQFITGGKTLVLTPRFSPRDQRIIYLSYAEGAPKVRSLAIETGSESVIGNFPGMTFAPRYNNDGSRLLMSVAQDGKTDIYELDVRNKTKRNLTNTPAIDTSPFYSPDQSQIVFSSDRAGAQQLYIMSANGGEARRITFGKGNYSTPVWSPRGDYIAFTKQSGGEFHIGVIRPDGSGERLLTSSYLDEGPSWSPNGRVIVFARQSRGGKARLYSIDITGYNERLIPTPGDASDPTWSPLLK